ncbi:MAG: sigma-54 dependent transcriptional regulator [Candidatus Eisenbacteria bacterium]
MTNTVFIAGRIPEKNRDLPGALRGAGFEVAELAGGEETLRALRGKRCCELVVVGTPEDIAPRALLGGLGRRFPDTRGVLLLPEPDRASLLGDDFLNLSGRPTAEVVDAVRGLLTSKKPRKPELRLIGRGREMERVRRMIEQVAPTSMTVLITGESGTGKEVVARLVHEESLRREKPFVAVNCAALPEGILESELFGHEKGAFTGATARREGRFELAHKGTLFLDEIADMPVQTQAKLLRVLEEKRFLRVGGVRDVIADVRLLAATNTDLEAAVQDGRFREDLFYRLNVIQVHIPPLRERREDIPDLVEAFLADASADHGTEPVRFTGGALQALAEFHWPGNVRQLKNLVEKITILEHGETIDADRVSRFLGERFSRSRHLPVPLPDASSKAERELIVQNLLAIRRELAELREMLIRSGPVRVSPGSYRPSREGAFGTDAEVVELEEYAEPRESRTAADFEKEAIQRALAASGGNRRRTAEILQIGERTLYRKLKKHGLD